MDIGYLFNKHTDNKDIDMSKLMDDLNKTESYKPLQKAMKDQKEYHKMLKNDVCDCGARYQAHERDCKAFNEDN